MKTLRLTALLGVAAVVGASSGAFAQTAEPLAPAKSEVAARRQILIKIKNVPSALVAYQLDPKHNPRPAALGAPSKTEEKGAFELPGGIVKIVSVDPQNLLLIAYEVGHDEAVRQLQELIEVLDQPQRQLDIEVQVVEMNPEDSRTFGLDFSKAPDDVKEKAAEKEGKLIPKVGTVRNNYTARLNALIADNRAKIVSAPRLTVFNNFRAEIPLTENRVLRLTPVAGGDPTLAPSIPISAVLLAILPTINGDGSVSLQIDVVRKPQESDAALSKVGVTAIVHVRDGATIIMGNLSPLFPGQASNVPSYKVPLLKDIPIINRLFPSKTPGKPQETLIFITPRIIRNFGEDEIEAATPQK